MNEYKREGEKNRIRRKDVMLVNTMHKYLYIMREVRIVDIDITYLYELWMIPELETEDYWFSYRQS